MKDIPKARDSLSKLGEDSAGVELVSLVLLGASRRRSAIVAANRYAQGLLGSAAAAPLCSARLSGSSRLLILPNCEGRFDGAVFRLGLG